MQGTLFVPSFLLLFLGGIIAGSKAIGCDFSDTTSAGNFVS